MTDGMKYGDVALGVESALPAVILPGWRHSRAQIFITRLIAALRRWT